MDIHEASVLEPLLQIGPWTDAVAGLLERAEDFVVVPLESGAVEAVIFREGAPVPVLELNPAARLD